MIGIPVGLSGPYFYGTPWLKTGVKDLFFKTDRVCTGVYCVTDLVSESFSRVNMIYTIH